MNVPIKSPMIITPKSSKKRWSLLCSVYHAWCMRGLTIEKIKTEFSHITAWTGNSETYHDSPIFEGYGNFCDLYFKSKNKQIKQEQVDKYNEFKSNFKNFLPDIEKYILRSLKNSEINIENKIRQSKLNIEIIEIPFENFKYDVLKIDRVSFAGLTKKNLPRGNWRFLTEQEIINLKNL